MTGEKRQNDSSSNETNGKKRRLGDTSKAPAIGIDLGTTYSCVGVFQHGKVEIIVNDQGDKTTPSYVSFTPDEILIGKPAKEQAKRNVNNTIFGVKRLLGRNYNDVTVQTEIKNYPFEVIDDNNKPKIKIRVDGETKIFVPEEISSMILIKMREAAEAYLGRSVSKAVITVPAYFNDAQRQATKDAAAIAKLEVLRIINEPTAAAIAYGLEKKVTKEREVMIFDLGGGTFDVSILKIADDFFEVVSTAGDTHLGGEDFDNRMVNYFVEEFKRKHKKDLRQNQKAINQLKTHCEHAKKILSSSTVASVDVDSIHDGIDFYSSITRARFEEINADLFRKTLEPVEKSLRDANIGKSQIQEVVLVGGSTRIPKIQKMLQDFFNGIELNKSINPDEAVAYGAAMQAAMLNGDESKEVKDLLLIDVTPLSLGIEVLGDGMDFVVKRNTTIPTKQTKIFTTSEDNQSLVDFKVYEGEHMVSKQNNLLGHFALKDVPPKPEDEGKFEVTFDIDANGILNVTALDKLSGKMNGITLKYNKNRLSQEEIERMIKDAEIFAAKLKKQKALPEAKNSLESYCNDLKNTVRGLTLNDVIIDSDKDMILNKCDEIIKWLRSNKSIEVGQIEQKQSELEAIDHTFIVMAKDPTKKEEKYREILSIGKEATKKQVREGYILAVKKYHPDKVKGDKVFAQLMFRVAVNAKKFLLPLSAK